MMDMAGPALWMIVRELLSLLVVVIARVHVHANGREYTRVQYDDCHPVTGQQLVCRSSALHLVCRSSYRGNERINKTTSRADQLTLARKRRGCCLLHAGARPRLGMGPR